MVLKPEVIGDPACPILHRWTLTPKTRFGKLLLHHFLPNADDRADHDHPCPFITFVLRGGYDDLVPCPWCQGTGNMYFDLPMGADLRADGYCPRCGSSGTVPGDRMRPGMIRFRAATYRHRTRVSPAGCWTLVLMGPKQRSWGFWIKGVWMDWREHERRFGAGMRCPDESGSAVADRSFLPGTPIRSREAQR